MSAIRLELKTFPARFRMRFAHGASVRYQTENIICIASKDDLTGYGEGCPRDYVTRESVYSAIRFFQAHKRGLEAQIHDLESLQSWIVANGVEINANPAAFAAVEFALIDLFARQAGQAVEAFLGLPPPRPLKVSAVFGIGSSSTARILAAVYRLVGMTDAKVKLSGEVGADRLRLVAIRQMLGKSARLRADANNVFRFADDCAAKLKDLGVRFWAVEEPLAVGDFRGMRNLVETIDTQIILDESAIRPSDLGAVEGPNWIVNLRVSKHGGLIRSFEMLRAARSRGLGIILGCHVGETGLLTRAGLVLGVACGEDLIAAESGYGGYLLARNLTVPSLRFGWGGLIHAPHGDIGTGVNVNATLLKQTPGFDG